MSDIKINDKAAAFVSDWKKRTDKQQKKHMAITILAFILTFATCIVMFFWFQDKNYDRIVEQNMNYIQDSAIQETNQIEKEMQSAVTQIINLAAQYSNLDGLYNDLTIEEKLALMYDNKIFDGIAFIKPDGTDVSLEGVVNVADRDYFKNAMNGKTGWESLEESRFTGDPSVVFYAPVYENGKIAGAMIGFYKRDKLDDLFSYQLFNYSPNTYLLLGDGTVVANSKDEDYEDNIFDVLSQKNFIGDTDFDKIMEVINDEKRTTITFSFVDRRNTSVATIVQFNESDWMILSVLPHTITAGMVSDANKIGTILLVSIITVFVFLSVLMLISFRKQKKHFEKEMEFAANNLELTIAEERKQVSIIESLIDTYSSVYYIDLITDSYQKIKENEKSTHSIPNEGSIHKGFEAYVEKFIDDVDKKEMYEFLDINTLSERLSENDAISIEYQRADKGWRRATVTTAMQDELGTIKSVIFAVQIIDQEKAKEIQTKEALQSAYEAAQLASKAKTTFLSNMSHDIRTPMNAIIGMTAIAGANLDNIEKVSDCLKKITVSSKHLLGLINEVLDMSKIESGKVDLSEEEFTLSDTIDNLISLNQSHIDEKHQTLTVKVTDVRHENVIGDSIRLQQVFTNLLSNAIKYTPDNGKIEIYISEKQTNKPKIGWYEVIFRDNGIGMTEETQKILFDPFERAKDNRIVGVQGTGLGMPIAKNIINMMNGDIVVKSRINEGTEIKVTFALKLQTEEDVDYSKFLNLPILVVDDDIYSCESACTILESLEMSSEYVLSGREAVEKVVEHHEANDDYYALIIDWKMPDMNGVETTKEIRKRVGHDVPIIVISSYDWTEIEQEARAAGADAFLSKPLFKSRVAYLFNELLGNVAKPEVKSLNDKTKNHDFSGKRVLLAEDNELNSEITMELLSMLGIETELAVNGKIAVEKFSQSEPDYYDLIFMDIQMPVMNGYDATMAIRALSHSDAKKIPIIAMTANAFASDVQNAFNVGMNGHIAKPLDIDQIIKSLYTHLGDK